MVGPRTRAAADRLVILVIRIAEGEIVHRALRGREATGRGEERVGHDLARLDIARDDRRAGARIEHRAFGHA